MNNNDESKNYYEVLEVPTDATQNELQQNYKRAKNAYSEDSLALYSLMSKEECERIARLIDEAYTILSDPDKRKQYDQARGIKRISAHSVDKNFTSSAMGEQTSSSQEDNTQSTNVSDMVAKKKFALDFEVDHEFEQEIENTVIFNGELLQRIREYKKVDLARMSDMIKISKTYLKHIEADNLDGLPALVYVRGFVYQYAKCLKLSPDSVAKSYLLNLKNLQEA